MELPIYDGATFGGISVAYTVAVRALSADEIEGIRRKEKKDLDRSVRVMSRIHFTNHLRFSLPLSLVTIDIDDAIQGYDRNDLEIYPLCTCLDTLAGQDNFLDFASWTQTLRPEFAGIQERENFLDVLYSSNKTFEQEIYSSLIKKLLELYQRNYSVTKNIRNLINNLPLFIRQELANSYTIHKVTEPAEAWGGEVYGTKGENNSRLFA